MFSAQRGYCGETHRPPFLPAAGSQSPLTCEGCAPAVRPVCLRYDSLRHLQKMQCKLTKLILFNFGIWGSKSSHYLKEIFQLECLYDFSFLFSDS